MLQVDKANRVIMLIFSVLLTSTICYAKHLHLEKDYQKYWCDKHNGTMEVKLDDNARVDCLTDKYAVEVDFAPKWAECIGQAVYYAKKTRKKPACLLIMENGEDDNRFLYRLRYSVYQKKQIKGFKTFTIKPCELERNCKTIQY